MRTLAFHLARLRALHHSCARRMGAEGVAWHCYRVPGTDQFTLMRADAQGLEQLQLVVRDVHAMSADTLVSHVHDVVLGNRRAAESLQAVADRVQRLARDLCRRRTGDEALQEGDCGGPAAERMRA